MTSIATILRGPLMKDKFFPWYEDAQKLQMSLIYCPQCRKPIGYMEKGRGAYFCKDCKGIVKAEVAFEAKLNEYSAQKPEDLNKPTS